MNRDVMRKLSLALLLAASALAAPSFAQINFNINVAPPPPQQEVVPAVAPGYVWAPGYWGWSGDRHVWIRGRPIAQREGYLWQPDRWEQREHNYYRVAGHWEKQKKNKKHKDKDRDEHDGHDKGKHRGKKHDS
jgi:hypothetical protein